MRWLAALGLLLALCGLPAVSRAQAATFTASPAAPTTLAVGASVTLSWTDIHGLHGEAPTSSDWIGLYHPGDTNWTDYRRVNCTQTPTVAVPSGSCAFPVPTAGTWEFRLQWYQTYDVIGGPAGPFTMSAGPTPTPTVTLTPTPTPTPAPVQPAGLAYTHTVTTPEASLTFDVTAPARIIISGRGTYATGPVSLGLRFNGDATGTSYSWINQIVDGQGSPVVYGAHGGGDETRIRVGWLPGHNAAATSWGLYRIVVGPHSAEFGGGVNLSSTPQQMGFTGFGAYYGAAAVASVTLIPDVGQFDSSTQVWAWKL